jgi:hypothetical protein
MGMTPIRENPTNSVPVYIFLMLRLMVGVLVMLDSLHSWMGFVPAYYLESYLLAITILNACTTLPAGSPNGRKLGL